MTTLSISYFQTLFFITSIFILANFKVQATEVDNALQQSLETVDKTHQQQKKSQTNINKLSDETQNLIKAYQQINRNTQYQLAYQEQLQKTIVAQENK